VSATLLEESKPWSLVKAVYRLSYLANILLDAAELLTVLYNSTLGRSACPLKRICSAKCIVSVLRGRLLVPSTVVISGVGTLIEYNNAI
jgi:hypothetical protein